MSETEGTKGKAIFARRDRRPRPLVRFCVWTGSAVFALCIVLGLVFLSLVGSRLAAPDWLRERVTQEVNASVEGVSLGFGDMAMVIEDGLVPVAYTHLTLPTILRL